MILLVGFLGAGKTTLLKAILREFADRKIGVIINEFGEINIDAKLIKTGGIQITELSNGSIFCSCIKDKFVESLIEISHRDIEYLFIEASGLADPANMQVIIDYLKPKLKTPYDYKGAICVIDGESFTDLYEVLPAIESQIRYSSAVIINKGDLIDENTTGEIIRIIEGINPAATIQVVSYCKTDVMKLTENLMKSGEEARDSVNTVETRPNTFIVKGIGTIPYETLKAFLGDIAGQTYRIKGFAKTDRGGMEVSCVRDNVEIAPWDEDVEETALVVISAVGFKLISSITGAIDNHAKGLLRI
jgi:G3E family GTPase